MKIRSLSSRAARSGRRSGGFSLVELMVGVGIGLLCTLVIATVLGATEGRRRGTMQGSDMQVSGSLALYNLQREIATAGYGFANDGAEVGCQLQAKYNGAAVTALPSVLAPVFVTEGANGASDQVRVLASSKFVNSNPAALSTVGYTAPSRIILPYYAPNDTVYNVASSLSISKGDLLVAIAKDTTQACGLFQVTGDPTPTTVPRANDPTHWNAVGHPSQTSAEWSFLVNLGNIIDVNFTADADGKLTASRLDSTTLTRTQTELQSNIVLMKAMYGRDTNLDKIVDIYDYTTPTNNAEWLNVYTVRLAVVARSAQYEKEEVTTANPLWDVGKSTTVAGSVDCGSSKCVELKIDGGSDWKHYRYKVFDTVVPLRNARWR